MPGTFHLTKFSNNLQCKQLCGGECLTLGEELVQNAPMDVTYVVEWDIEPHLPV